MVIPSGRQRPCLRKVTGVYAGRVRGVSTLAGLLAFGSCTPAERPLASNASAPSALRLQLPGPAPRGRTAEHAAALNGTCEGCHVEIADEWRSSLHARSHTDAVYQRALAIEPLAFCQSCHAPEADPNRPVPDSVAAIGVACVTCHVLGGDIVAGADQRDQSSWAPARTGASGPAHPVLRDGRLGAATACAGCHEFEFPDGSARRVPELMQSTVTEHSRSPQRDQACADCHMPTTPEVGRASHRSHAFVGGRDTAFVKSAVAVSARRTDASTVRVSIAPRNLGHAFPTGDLFRRVEVSAEAVGSDWQVLASERRYLARHWVREPSPLGIVLRLAVSDDRPLASPVEVEFQLGERAAGLPIVWRVAYQRVAHPRSEDETDSAVEGEIEIASGTLRHEP